MCLFVCSHAGLCAHADLHLLLHPGVLEFTLQGCLTMQVSVEHMSNWVVLGCSLTSVERLEVWLEG